MDSSALRDRSLSALALLAVTLKVKELSLKTTASPANSTHTMTRSASLVASVADLPPLLMATRPLASAWVKTENS